MVRRVEKYLVKNLQYAILTIAVIFAPAAQSADIEQITQKLRKGDFSVVKTELVPMAEAGNSKAQFSLGISYALGHGVPQDFVKSYEWTKKAAENGDTRAQVNLASIYYEGRGIKRDISESVKWYDEASQAGDLNATLALGRIHRDGATRKIDYAKAYEYFSKAAAKGDNEAKYNLAGFYRYGLGVKADEVKSKELFASLPGLDNSMAANFASMSPAAGKKQK